MIFGLSFQSKLTQKVSWPEKYNTPVDRFLPDSVQLCMLVKITQTTYQLLYEHVDTNLNPFLRGSRHIFHSLANICNLSVMNSSFKKSDTACEGSDNACPVCFKDVEIFSIGICDHPICHECSTRMRVLCKEDACPICRQELNKVAIYSLDKFSFLPECLA